MLHDLRPEVHSCGEYGEFHSFVYDGPIFSRPVAAEVGEIVIRDGRYYADLLRPDGQFCSHEQAIDGVNRASSEGSLASSVLFFIVTNLAVWASGSLYPRTLAGLMVCYTAAIPFFRNSLIGDMAFTAALFGGFAWLENAVVSLREKQ